MDEIDAIDEYIVLFNTYNIYLLCIVLTCVIDIFKDFNISFCMLILFLFIGGKRFSEGTSADCEIQRTLMELLNQMDGFDTLGQVYTIHENVHVYVHVLRLK